MYQDIVDSRQFTIQYSWLELGVPQELLRSVTTRSMFITAARGKTDAFLRLGASRPSPCQLRSSIVLSLRSVTERRSNTATNFTRDSGEFEARSLAMDQGRASSTGPRCIYSCISPIQGMSFLHAQQVPLPQLPRRQVHWEFRDDPRAAAQAQAAAQASAHLS